MRYGAVSSWPEGSGNEERGLQPLRPMSSKTGFKSHSLTSLNSPTGRTASYVEILLQVRTDLDPLLRNRLAVLI
jgi:hypothetical protein